MAKTSSISRNCAAVILCFTLGAYSGFAQEDGGEFIAPPQEDVGSTITESTPDEVRIGRARFDIDGIVAAVFRNPKPWQLVSPLAPPEAGNGENMVSRDEKDPAKPKGFIFFGIEW